ncbi:MAG: helix-hairpin-helix domain-containing protein [Bacillaceae bacterium]|nr:helix-hairpin-helix domain-containing protein [Bacillaceae bacterium]
MKERLLEQKYAIIIGVIAIAVIGYLHQTKDQATFASESNSALLMEKNSLEHEKQQEEITEPMKKPDVSIIVDVKGAVKYEGVYQLLEGQRIMDAIEKAGGLLDDADHRKINFAAKLQDQMVVFIPQVGEDVDTTALNSVVRTSETSNNSDGKININTATVEQLQTLSGIGQAKAKAIIVYREDNGYFKSIDELTNVSGIGVKSLDNIRQEITVGN